MRAASSFTVCEVRVLVGHSLIYSNRKLSRWDNIIKRPGSDSAEVLISVTVLRVK